MTLFHIRYRNSQGAFMRIMNAVSRRGLDFFSVHAEPVGADFLATLLLELSPQQIGQVQREWLSIVDVIEVKSSAGLHGHEEAQWVPLPPVAVGSVQPAARAAMA